MNHQPSQQEGEARVSISPFNLHGYTLPIHTAILFVLSCIVCSASPPPPINTDITPSEAIQMEYIQMNADFVQHNLNGVMSFFTPDFFATSSDGKQISLKQTRQQYQQQLSQMKTMHSDYTVMNCRPTSSGYLMEIRVHSAGTGFKRILFAKINGSFTNDLCVRDLWVQNGNAWHLKHRVILEDNTQEDPG